MINSWRFSVYKLRLVVDGALVSRHFIVIADKATGVIILWTDFHKYIGKNRRNNLKSVYSNSREQFLFVAKLLNYVYFEKYQIRRLTDLTIDMVKSFLNDYGLKRLPGDSELTHRTKSTVDQCQKTVLNFLTALSRSVKCLAFKETDLYTTEKVFSKHKRRMVAKKVVAFSVHYFDTEERMIFRDIPEKAFKVIFDVVAMKYRHLLMLVCLGAFAGLRPSEACNVRREDSALGAGIRFELINNEVVNVYIDLRRKYNLRSDLVDVGGIKKYRVQKVYPNFLEAFYVCYQEYCRYTEGRKYETQFGALTNNRNGKAYTYHSYYQEFQRVVNDSIPVMLRQEDPEVVNYGMLLQEKRISPHIFRHWFSTKLALYNEDPAGLMYWRGDKSVESALTYIQNKSDLTKQYANAVNRIFDYEQWKAGKIHGKQDD